ncbi:MAG: 5'-nucleotidase C-terminal domain-containing protein [Chitinophagales bacterium]
MPNRFVQQLMTAMWLWAAVSGCRSTLQPVQYHAVENRMSDTVRAFDAHIDSVIMPYRESLRKEMDEVVVESEAVFTKKQPESSLGNLLADIELKKAIDYTHAPVDFAIINYGGIRLPQLPQGNITVGKVYELMPFDNMLVVVELDGKSTALLFERMAEAGGVPLAGARFTVIDGKIKDITIGGQPFDESRTYRVALSDYLANGGDQLDFLKGKTQVASNKLLRDAFIEGFREIKNRGEKIKPQLDGRVRIAVPEKH